MCCFELCCSMYCFELCCSVYCFELCCSMYCFELCCSTYCFCRLCCSMYCFCRLCCSMYCLRVNVYCTTATACQPNCSSIYHIKHHTKKNCSIATLISLFLQLRLFQFYTLYVASAVKLRVFVTLNIVYLIDRRYLVPVTGSQREYSVIHAYKG
jgi:hypothetical protein